MSIRVSAADDTQNSPKNIEIQLLTQADFDTMSESRQAFIRDRIKAGQVKIVSPEELAPPPHPQPKSSSPPSNITTQKAESRPKQYPPRSYISDSPIKRLLGKSVKCVLNNGEFLIGTLKELWQFEIVLNVSPDHEIIVLKHAIASIEEDKNGCQTLLQKIQGSEPESLETKE
jgi:sRNA-binding regulator protein Hfq